jgi:F-box and WD-40 domain protein CDC4
MRSHRLPIIQPDQGVVTSLAMDDDWIVVSLTSCKIHVFSRRTGVLSRTLVGCQGGVWAVWLIGSGGTPLLTDDLGEDEDLQQKQRIPEPIRIGLGLDPNDSGGGENSGNEEKRRPSRSSTYDALSSSDGWGQPNAFVVSGGCDKVVRVWDVLSG